MCHSITIIQEAHGGPEAVIELQRRLHLSHLILFSCTSSTAAGGLLFCVSRTLLSTCTHYYFDVMIPGRVAILSLFFPSGTLVIAGIHLLPALRTLQRASLLRRLSRRLPPLTWPRRFSPGIGIFYLLANLYLITPLGLRIFGTMVLVLHLITCFVLLPNFINLLRRTNLRLRYLA